MTRTGGICHGPHVQLQSVERTVLGVLFGRGTAKMGFLDRFRRPSPGVLPSRWLASPTPPWPSFGTSRRSGVRESAGSRAPTTAHGSAAGDEFAIWRGYFLTLSPLSGPDSGH